ncbi:hypothetical protein [Flavonifractor sp. An306]|uniref:hypothetical protein n=1 Tax=Flavonifractor sp. An306 TaxID=1965629 RepID=UPI00174AC5CD|nr:hypothetical protein [Flavonifractor sp. An306]
MKENEKYIYVCPSGCNAPLVCDFDVTETWFVDPTGEPVELESSDGPGLTTKTPRCSKCQAKAEEHKCKGLTVWSETNERLGAVYVPAELDDIVFFKLSHSGLNNVERLTVRKKDNMDAICIGGTIYLLTDDGFRPRQELPGQESLFSPR